MNRFTPVSGPTFVDATEGGKRLRRGAQLWTVAVSTFKAETYRFLRLERPTEEDIAEAAAFLPGSVHLPHWAENEWLDLSQQGAFIGSLDLHHGARN